MWGRVVWTIVVTAGCRVNFDELPGGALPPIDGAATPDTKDDDIIDDGGDPSLVMAFDFESFADGETADPKSGFVARCTTACPTPIAGPVGNALRFNTDEMTVDYDPRFATPSAVTVALWIRYRGIQGAVFSRPAVEDIFNTWQIEVLADEATFTTADGEGRHEKMGSGQLLVNDVWTHVAGVWTGTTKRIYVDGVMLREMPWDQVVEDPDLPLVIGFDLNSGVAELHVRADLDELRLYNRALDDAEIALLALPPP